MDSAEAQDEDLLASVDSRCFAGGPAGMEPLGS